MAIERLFKTDDGRIYKSLAKAKLRERYLTRLHAAAIRLVSSGVLAELHNPNKRKEKLFPRTQPKMSDYRKAGYFRWGYHYRYTLHLNGRYLVILQRLDADDGTYTWYVGRINMDKIKPSIKIQAFS